MSETQIKQARINKLNAIKKAGINAYPSDSQRTRAIGDVLKDFDKLAESGRKIFLVGRIRTIREHGGSTFFHFEDESGRMQAYLKRDEIGSKDYQSFLDNFDIGDFIEAKGSFFKTKKGEKTILISSFRILAKTLEPLPDKWHGLQDIEERFRKRYLDLLMNSEMRMKFNLRSKIIDSLRDFLKKEKFLEVETPMLHPIPGGALAKPFKTHHNALDADFYLRIAPELYLKRLIVGGYERVFEIGRNFRNEGMDSTHNPEFTMLELYRAYTDYKELMKFTRRMILFSLKKVLDKTEIGYQGKTIDFFGPWSTLDYGKLLEKYNISLKDSKDELISAGKRLGVNIEPNQDKWHILDDIFKKAIRPEFIQPTFVINHPIEISPLAKKLSKDESRTERFQFFVGGMELINGFSELNDPIDQKARFQEQEKTKEGGKEESHRYDADFVEALEHGLPPTAGLGLGLDRFAALLTDSHSIKEIILFPTLRPKK
ncbi:MAG: lysine--tRNA ligase [Parcubacteria group bacterium]|nr:lysine--tRNA ligase [Parcubacteria group bacterium]